MKIGILHEYITWSGSYDSAPDYVRQLARLALVRAYQHERGLDDVV